jgi:hypothetical protein
MRLPACRRSSVTVVGNRTHARRKDDEWMCKRLWEAKGRRDPGREVLSGHADVSGNEPTMGSTVDDGGDIEQPAASDPIPRMGVYDSIAQMVAADRQQLIDRIGAEIEGKAAAAGS